MSLSRRRAAADFMRALRGSSESDPGSKDDGAPSARSFHTSGNAECRGAAMSLSHCRAAADFMRALRGCSESSVQGHRAAANRAPMAAPAVAGEIPPSARSFHTSGRAAKKCNRGFCFGKNLNSVYRRAPARRSWILKAPARTPAVHERQKVPDDLPFGFAPFDFAPFDFAQGKKVAPTKDEPSVEERMGKIKKGSGGPQSPSLRLADLRLALSVARHEAWRAGGSGARRCSQCKDGDKHHGPTLVAPHHKLTGWLPGAAGFIRSPRPVGSTAATLFILDT